jgi:dTDP-L-rhamnose 4-epimerase
MKHNILITGGAGFIGSHLADRLIEEGHSVRILDSLDPQVHQGGDVPDYLDENLEFIKGDMRDKNIVKESLKDIEVVFHQAAAVGVGQSMYEVEKYVEANTFGTAKLLDILAGGEHDVKKLIVASSMSIYGEGKYECENCGIVYPELRPDDQLENKEWELKCPTCSHPLLPLPTDETKPIHPTSIYAITKRDQEEMCLNIGGAYGIPTVALRYFNVYGTRQALSNPYTGVAAIFSSRILNQKSPMIFEDGLQSRDFVHVSDIVQANLRAMTQKSGEYEAFNIGTGKKITIMDIAETLIEKLDPAVSSTIVDRYRKGDIRHCFSDISKARKKLGYEPRVMFSDGISDLTKWVKSQDAVDSFDKAQDELKSKGLVK